MKHLSLFRNWDNISRLVLIKFLTTLYFYTPYMTIYFLGRGLNFLEINSMWGISVFTMFLAEVPTGLLADRWDRRRVIQIAILFQLIGEVLFLFISSYWLLVIVAVIAGIGFAFSSGAQEAFIFDELKEKGREGEMNKVMGRFNAAGYLGFITSFALSGLLVQQASQNSIKIAILATAIAVGVGFLVTLTLKKSPVNEETHPTSQSTLILLKDGIKLIRRYSPEKLTFRTKQDLAAACRVQRPEHRFLGLSFHIVPALFPGDTGPRRIIWPNTGDQQSCCFSHLQIRL